MTNFLIKQYLGHDFVTEMIRVPYLAFPNICTLKKNKGANPKNEQIPKNIKKSKILAVENLRGAESQVQNIGGAKPRKCKTP